MVRLHDEEKVFLRQILCDKEPAYKTIQDIERGNLREMAIRFADHYEPLTQKLAEFNEIGIFYKKN